MHPVFLHLGTPPPRFFHRPSAKWLGTPRHLCYPCPERGWQQAFLLPAFGHRTQHVNTSVQTTFYVASETRSKRATGNHAAATVGAGCAVARTRDAFVRPLLWLAVFDVSGSSTCFMEDPMRSTPNQVVSEPCE